MIYKSEIEAGLSELLKVNSTLAFAPVSIVSDPDLLAKLKLKAIAQNSNQMDLYYLSSILVSTGWNKNDDVFDPVETWRARNSPEDKPFNFMHDEKDIIGHITGNYVVDFDGNRIPDESDNIPENFNIVTSAVVYREWSDAERKERIANLIKEIETTEKWFVSMECLFPNFDYALLDKNGNQHIIQRDEASAFLTQHLRAYGGQGVFEDYKLGRLLRNFAFSGKGLVDRPGNPRSIIIKETQAFSESKAKQISISSIVEKRQMEKELEDLKNQVTALKAELANLKTENSTAKLNVEEKDKVVASLKTELESVKAQLVEINKAFETVKAANLKLEEEKAALAKAADEMDKKYKDMEKKEKTAKRKAALVEAGVEDADVETTLAKFDSVSDEAFDHVVALFKKDKKEKKEEEDKSKSEEAAKKQAEEAEAAKKAAAAVLETAEPVRKPELNQEAGDEGEKSVRASASDWFSSFLKSTANLKK